jgi:hypothetical protein
MSGRENDDFAGQSPDWAEVALAVYELHGTAAINFVTSAAGIGGAYHVGVQVYGLEWSYGGRDEGTGLDVVHLGQSSLGSFHSRIPLGKTRVGPNRTLRILDNFRRRWHGSTYHLLACNCTHFSVEFAKQLGMKDKDIPAWINSLAKTGAATFGSEAGPLKQPLEEENLDAYEDDQIEEMAEDGDIIAGLEMVWRQAEDFTLDWVEKAKNNSQSEDFEIEFRWKIPRDDAKKRNTVLGIMTNEYLSQYIAESTSSALGLNWAPSDGDDGPPCPIIVSRLQTVSATAIKARCRARGKETITRVKRKPDRERFEGQFKRAMKTKDFTPQQRSIMDEIQMDTTPGEPTLGHRVIMNTRNRKGAPPGGQYASRIGQVMMPRQEFKSVDSSAKSLAKLHALRKTVLEQSATHRTLTAMMSGAPEPPWWSSGFGGGYGGQVR